MGRRNPAAMAGKDLDALAEALASERISRGKALKRIGALFLGGVLASAPMAAAFADNCPQGKKKCGGRCIPNGHDCVKGGGKPHGSPPGQNR
jgi:hypothetical protein